MTMTATRSTGVKCGNVKVHGREFPAYHLDAAAVKRCYQGFDEPDTDQLAEWDRQAASELAAERASERFFEEGPHGGTYAGSAEEAMDRAREFYNEGDRRYDAIDGAVETVVNRHASPLDSLRDRVRGMNPDRPSIFPTRPEAAPAPVEVKTHQAPTAPQLGLLDRLAKERKGSADVLRDVDRASLTKTSISKVIKALKELPFKPEHTTEVPDGHYAIEEEGVVKFFAVRTPTEGKWKGFTFVDAQASDDYHPVTNRTRRAEVLKAIAADLKAAMVLYGREVRKCGRCNRTLTDEDSRAAGIGPICAQKMGW